jgi:Kef-type K+ transport system membrane component KefB/predicted amino acid-binding ACT domain protein
MNVTDILVDIVVVLVAAKIAAEIAERIGISAVIGEIAAGIVVGPSVFGLLGSSHVIEVLGELGVILLLLEVGLELSVGDLRAVGRSSLAVALIGVVVPVALGVGTGLAFGESGNTALFLGAALAATSVGITARVLSDLGALTRLEGRTVLGAAVADDVLGLVLLTIVVRVVTAGTVDVFDVLKIVGVALAFLVVAVAVGTRYGPRVFQYVERTSRSAGTFVAIALAFTLVFASLADAAELAPIVGAFAAGVALSGSAPAARVRRELAPVGHLFIPVFFLQIGVHADLSALTDPGSLALVGVLTAVAIVGKLAAGIGMFGTGGDRLLVGFGMLPRGEVGLIFASIGLASGVLDDSLYAVLVSVVLLTTLMAPPCLRWRIKVIDARRPEAPPTPMPEGGWLVVGDDVALAAEPPVDDALVVALDAARMVNRAPPANDLLDWLGRVDLGHARWDRRATARLLELLRDGSVRSWRFLEAAGILERALPEVAEAVRRRQADPFQLDPSNVLRFELVDALRDLVTHDAVAATVFERLRYPEIPMLAALVLSVTGDLGDPGDLASRVSDRLRLGARAEEELVALVRDVNLMRATALRIDGLDEEPVLVLATHLEAPERVRALYLASLAVGALEPWERDRLDDLLARLLQVLAQTDLAGRRAGSAIDVKRREALRHTSSAIAAQRILGAPRAYLLAQPPETVARHATLLDPAPRRGTLRVSTAPLDDASGRIEVVALDRPGLLAAVTGVLAERRIDVLDAVATTWPDGAVVESYVVRTVEPFAAAVGSHAELERAIEAALRSTGGAAPAPTLEIDFDADVSPWYTLCEVRGPDRPGLLHAVTVGFATMGVTVHSARIETIGGVAIDRFELSDTAGRKLDAHTQRAVRDAIWSGSAGNGSARGRRRLRRRERAAVGGG